MGKRSVRIHTTITIPPEWEEKIREYMKKHGYTGYAELFRELLRRVLVED